MFLFGFLAHHSMLRFHAARLDKHLGPACFHSSLLRLRVTYSLFWSLLQALKLHVVFMEHIHEDAPTLEQYLDVVQLRTK